MTRLGQLALILAAVALWGASRLTWVQVSSFDGLTHPKTDDLTGATWSTALIPLALVVLAAAVAALAVRGWPMRILAVLVAGASAAMGYLAISLWVVPDVGARAARLAEVPITALVGTERHSTGAVLTLVAAALSLLGAVLLLRSSTRAAGDTARYARRPAETADTGDAMSERMIWDALDAGNDPTTTDKKGR
ncbi:MAG: TIGR02234 family membrane protein [Mycobacterium kyogaense]|uniref:TIGR02234 family membrane protein n=1 Tax=Mycobacterium kyogaense TaxID=2212479 RepID=UPI002FF4D54E